MIKQKEESDKRLLMLEWVVGIFSIIIVFVSIMVGTLLPMEDWLRIVFVLSGIILGFIGCCFAMKIEQVAGYYECQHCKNRYVPTYKAVNLVLHIGRTRYMKCSECNKKSWQRKVISKE